MVATVGPVPLIMPRAPRWQNAFDPAAEITSRCSREPATRASGRCCNATSASCHRP